MNMFKLNKLRNENVSVSSVIMKLKNLAKCQWVSSQTYLYAGVESYPGLDFILCATDSISLPTMCLLFNQKNPQWSMTPVWEYTVVIL